MIDFFEFSNEMLCLADHRGYFVKVNRAWTKTLGWTSEELTSRPYYDFVHPDDIAATVEESKLLLSGTHETIWFDNRYRCRDGSYRWVSWRAILEPKTQQLVCTARDITQQKLQAEALRESEERFRLLATRAPIGIAQSDVNGSVYFANGKWCELAGVELGKGMGFSWQNIIHPDDLEGIHQHWRNHIQAGLDMPAYEFRFVHQDGSFCWVSSSVAMLRDAYGNVVGQIGTLEDITERKASQDALRESEERFRAFMDNSPAVAWAKDEQGRFVYFNKSLEDRLQIQLKDWLGKTDFDLFPKELAQKMWDNDRKVLATGEPLQVMEESPAENQGLNYWYNNKFIFTDRQKRRFVGGVGVDITQLKLTEQALRSEQKLLEESNRNLESRVAERTAELTEANEKLRLEFHERVRAEERLQQQQTQLAHVSRLSTIGVMAAELAHEINQPLSAIGNYVFGILQSMRVGDVVSEELVKAMRQLESEAGRAANIIRRVRNFTRRSGPQPEGVSLNDLVGSVFRLLSAEARQRDIDLEIDLDESLPNTHVDPLQIEQVLVNLVRNAFDALHDEVGESRSVIVKTRSKGDALEVAVQDNGPGVSDEKRDRIFEPFFTTKHDGLGLGLAISRSIIEAHHGRLWVEPRFPRGTTFRFSFPIVSS